MNEFHLSRVCEDAVTNPLEKPVVL